MPAVIRAKDSDFTTYWSELIANDPLQNPLYANQAEGASQSDTFSDESFLIVSEQGPVFGCSLTMHTDSDGRRCLGYYGLEASTHVNVNSMSAPSNNFEPAAICLLQSHIDKLIEELKPDVIDYLDPVSCGLMSPVTQVLLDKGAVPAIQNVQVLDLSKSMQQLSRDVSARYRGLIHWGQRNLDLSVSSGKACLPEYELASQTNQPLYEELIRQNCGFVVTGSVDGRVVASAFFVHNYNTCYFVFADAAAFLNDRPALFGLVWQGISHARELGCGQFDLGHQLASVMPDSDFEFSVGGFGGEAQTRLKVSLERA